MASPATIEIPATDRVKLPLTYDVEKMTADIESLTLNTFMYYNVIPLTAPAHVVDPSLPVPEQSDDFADGTWTDWLETPQMAQLPYIKSIVDEFREKTRVTLVRLLRLAPGSDVKEHTDPSLALEVPKSVIRLTIPILRNKAVTFFLNGTPMPMLPGECWYMRLSDPHRIVNYGPIHRVNLTIDMEPNEWVRTMIADAAKEQEATEA